MLVLEGLTGTAEPARMSSTTRRMQSVRTPVIPVVGDMVRETPGAISLGQGVVHYGPPDTLASRLAEFFSDPHNQKYGPVGGIPPLLDALEAKLQLDNAISLSANNRLLVTAGGNMAFMNAVLAITDPGDEIILPVPYYFNHDMAIVMADCRTVPVPTDRDYQLIPEAIERAITARTRAVVTISPNNPSGAVYEEETLRAVNDICRRHGVYHMSDEAYEYFSYEGARHFSPGSIEGSAGHTISLFSLSKSYGFASWRIGYMVFPEGLNVAIRKIQDTILICPPVISQYAALGALDAGAVYCREKLQGIAGVREIVLRELQAIPDICTVPPARGAFYFLVNVHTRARPMEIVERLIREHGVAVIPGDAFGLMEGCPLRIAYGALEGSTAKEAILRLKRGLQALVEELDG